MNIETANAIATAWNREPAMPSSVLARRLVALLPEPEAWGVMDTAFLSLTSQSLFVVSKDGQNDINVRRALVTNDADTGISVTDGPVTRELRWKRTWTFGFPRHVPLLDLAFTTEPVIGRKPAGLEDLARKVAAIAGWSVGEPLLD